ncbi:hypothetical protein V7114_15480 [Neobacillus niacini]
MILAKGSLSRSGFVITSKKWSALLPKDAPDRFPAEGQGISTSQ